MRTKYLMYNATMPKTGTTSCDRCEPGITNPPKSKTVLANRLDTFNLRYFDGDGVEIDVAANPLNVIKCVESANFSRRHPASLTGTPGSPGYQPQSTVTLVSDVVLRNVSQLTY